jgi:hypothetical protein
MEPVINRISLKLRFIKYRFDSVAKIIIFRLPTFSDVLEFV